MGIPEVNSVTTIEELFRGKNVFVTGGSGFIGKVLLEKLLRSCPGIGNVYMLLREKKGKSLSERMDQIFSLQMFGPLKEKNPEVLKKIIPIGGDVAKIGLGLSDEDRKLLINEVSIVIHSAASIRFDDILKTAVFQNLRSTREVILLVEQLKEVTIFVHVSTAYSNCHYGHVEERLYPAEVPWRDMIRIAEEADEMVLQSLTDKFIGKLPNTYIFTKSLAEHAVNDMCRGKFPTLILRPSLVMPAIEEPLPGWVDNLNGPFVALAGYDMGLFKTGYIDEHKIYDHITVDNFVKSLIIATWLKAVEKENTKEVTIYNCTSEYRCTFGEYFNIVINIIDQFPMERRIWARSSTLILTLNWYVYFINSILYHILPATFIDAILRLLGKKPMLLKLQRKAYILNLALFYFMTSTITFANDNFNKLRSQLLVEDMQQFDYVIKSKEEYGVKVLCGVKQFLFNERVPVSQRTHRINKGFIILDKVVKAVWYTIMIYTLYSYRHIIQHKLEGLFDYVSL